MRLCLKSTQALMKDTCAIPNRIRSMKLCTSQLVAAASLRNKVNSEVLVRIANYNIKMTDNVHALAAHVKQYGYNLPQHPAFLENPRDDLLWVNYSLARKLHLEALYKFER